MVRYGTGTEVKFIFKNDNFLLFFSGMGYIVGAKMAELCGSWQWGLRATPVMGIVAVVLILLLLQAALWNRNRRNRNFLTSGTGTVTCKKIGTGTVIN
jgi:hypothetical protein